MPEAKVPCESCPWVAKGKRLAGSGQSDAERLDVASGAWRACVEDGGTCWGAVKFTQSPAAAELRNPVRPAVGRQQTPEAPDHRPTITDPTTAVDFVSSGPTKEDDA